MNNKVYIISGPTAVGKSLIAFYLAKRINGEIDEPVPNAGRRFPSRDGDDATYDAGSDPVGI